MNAFQSVEVKKRGYGDDGVSVHTFSRSRLVTHNADRIRDRIRLTLFPFPSMNFDFFLRVAKTRNPSSHISRASFWFSLPPYLDVIEEEGVKR